MPGQFQTNSPRRLRVFLCHSSDDKPTVHALYQHLIECNVDPWLDTEKLLGGQDWDLEIKKAIRKSDSAIICLSKDFTTKEGYGQKEIRRVLDMALEKPDGVNYLIPLKLEECELPERLMPFQWVNYFEEDGFEKLLRTLKHRKEQLKEDIAPIDTLGEVREFVSEFHNLTRTSISAQELRGAFQTAVVSKLGIRELKWGKERQTILRNHVIIEFKDKGFFRVEKQKKLEEVKRQLVNLSICNQARDDNRPISDYIGVCFDGQQLAFVFIEDDDTTRVTELRPFNERSAAALADLLDKDNRIELTPQNVVNDFGPDSQIARLVLNALWEHLDVSLAKHVNRAEMLYDEWINLFEQSTSLGKIGQARLSAYLVSIGIPPDADLSRILFVLHTYHALFFKLLAAELVLSNRVFEHAPADYCFSASTLSDKDLLDSLSNRIEDSNLFKDRSIRNFVEGTFFTWYLIEAPATLIAAVRALMQRLSLYRLRDLQLTRTRDVVKRVYQQLVPAALRHNIGEYFTPEWLVEFTLDRAGYNGAEILTKKYLDPCCGSGNFLIHAIDRYKTQARAAGWDNAAILHNITEQIAGFDLNPLAVLTARVNYLIAISDLLEINSDVEIPIYQADAIYAPTISTTSTATNPLRLYEIGTRKEAIRLTLPESLIQNRRLFGEILETMEQTIIDGETETVFLASLNAIQNYADQPERASWEKYLRDMFREVEVLEKRDWNRIWCRIVRNYFASVAVGKCQIIASNPPWVRWSELPASYTERIKPTCDSYGIFSEDRFFGGNELDISGMIMYTVADKWLDQRGGRLSFVITKAHFQTQSSGGFRRFEVKGQSLKVLYVDDFEKVRPFAGLATKPAVLTIEKGQPTSYPVDYIEWERTTSATISDDINLLMAQQSLKQTVLVANPLSEGGQRWSILPPGRFTVLHMLDGRDRNIEGRKGILTDLNGAYFIEPLGPGTRPQTVFFRNIPERGRHGVPECTEEVEHELVYPLIKGAANIRAFFATSSQMCVIIPNKGISLRAIPTVSAMAEYYPKALRYLRKMNEKQKGEDGKLLKGGRLEERSTWKGRMKPQFEKAIKQGKMAISDIPFYAIYDVGEYTFAPHKVVWAEMADTVQAAVISSAEVPYVGETKVIVPDHKVYFAAFNDPDFAHYVCALLNSEPIRTFVDSFTIKIQVGTLFRHINLPLYNPTNVIHKKLVDYSKEAHQILAATEGSGVISDQRRVIDELANQAITQISPTYYPLKLPWEQ